MSAGRVWHCREFRVRQAENLVHLDISVLVTIGRSREETAELKVSK
jgi:hypothetical protein